jgi:hypothetical protein
MVVKPEVVQNAEPKAQHLLRLEQMAKIGSRIPLADGTAAGFIYGSIVRLIFGVV